MAKELTLSKLKNTDFMEFYLSFLEKDQLTRADSELALSLAVCFINSKNIYIKRLGYRIIVQYCNKTQDYAPLYELAINYGLYPISKIIDRTYIEEYRKNVFTEFNNAFIEKFKDGNIYLTQGQQELKKFFSNTREQTVAVIAPTSYGKSELFCQLIRAFQGKKVGIIVPTKALIAQTKRRIKDDAKKAGFSKIVVTPEMYNNEPSLLAVLTQERLLRLFKCHDQLYFDCLVVDEAHELLEDGERSMLLAHTIILAQRRYQNTVFKFMTSLVTDENNLSVRYTTYDIESFKTIEYIKSEKFFIYDLRGKKDSSQFMLYDQFVDRILDISNSERFSSEEDIILKHSARKNIIYLNKPQDIEKFALKLAEKLSSVNSVEIDDMCEQISDYIDGKYNLVKCLQKGIIYHHSSVPESIKVYIEDRYKNINEIRFIVTTSTLLSGVNIPAEKMFILDCMKGNHLLKRSEFNNLIGRVCRFSEIFSPEAGSLRQLEPEIYIINGKYTKKNFDYATFINKVARVDKKYSDDVKNLLLNSTPITSTNMKSLDQSRAVIENYECGTIAGYSGKYLTTVIGKACIRNSITSFSIFERELSMQQNADVFRDREGIIDSPGKLVTAISEIFFNGIDEIDIKLPHLQTDGARAFYTMLLDWRINNKPYKEMIAAFISYWKRKANTSSYIYIGRWGDVALSGTKLKHYVIFSKKDNSEVTNLAIAKIKEEQDFIDNILIRYIEVLYDMQMVDEILYKKIKYGTDDPNVICMVKNGLPPYIAITLAKKYRDYMMIDTESSTLSVDSSIEEAMKSQHENMIVQYAIRAFVC